MELLSLKIIVLTISGAIRLFFGLLPLALIKSLKLKPEKNGMVKKIISLLMFFGGGVLIATCFLHMMPHVRESFSEAHLNTSLPVPEIIFIGGFFMVYMLEDLVHGWIHGRKKRKAARKIQDMQNATKVVRGFGYNNESFSTVGETGSKAAGTIIPRVRPESWGQTPTNGIYHIGGTPDPTSTSVPTVNIVTPNGRSLNNNVKSDNSVKTVDGAVVAGNFKYVDPEWWKDSASGNSQMNLLATSALTVRSASLYDIPLCSPVGSGVGSQSQGQLTAKSGPTKFQSIEYDAGSSSTGSTSASDSHHHHHLGHSHLPQVDDGEEGVAGAIRNLLIVVAISFHGIFEGMAIGLQGSEKDVWYLFLAVSLHECTILFCIGIELIASKTKVLRMIIYILIVSLVSPIGMAIGIIVSEANGDTSTVRHVILIGSLQGLAAGTLLYVAFFEIFVAEGKALQRKYVHIIVAIVGFIFMGALELVGGHSHGGGHSHSHGGPSSVKAAPQLVEGDHSDHDHDEHGPNGFHSHEDGHDHDHAGHSH